MAGIYIHVPFCKKACHYCNFHFSTSLSLKDEFTTALLKEIEITSQRAPGFHMEGKTGSYLGTEPVETIYFGGGTPSILPEKDLTKLIHNIFDHFVVGEGAEITLEANPDDINKENLKQWKAAGINRLSIGVQSFYDDDLRWMNRAHTAEQATDSVATAQQEGFENITIDLIYGTPLLTDERWERTIQQVLVLKVPHLSCYALTVEPFTALYKMIEQKKSPDTDPSKQADQFLILTDLMESHGYEHYEISNFAKPGMRSRHNSNYWRGKPYLGLGPSAHSFNRISRHRNIPNNTLYIKSLLNNIRPIETEDLTPLQRYNEYVMISLRTAEGINLHHIAAEFGENMLMHLKKSAKKYLQDGRLIYGDSVYQLTKEGKLFADGIASDLFG